MTKKKEATAQVAPQNNDNAIIPHNEGVANFQQLITQAIDKGTGVETMERLLAMFERVKATQAKEEFDKAMAKFQSECPVISKTKEVKTKNGTVAYRYAPIDSIVEQVKVPLQQNGFSYTTSMELMPAGVKVAVKVTHVGGHSEVTPMEVPLGNKTDIMSQSQVVAAATTFAKRYAFCNALGILTGDEDNDALPQPGQAPADKPAQQAAPQPAKPVAEANFNNPATPKQINWIKGLVKQKGQEEKVTKEQIEALTMGVASQWIARLKEMPDVEVEKPADKPVTETENELPLNPSNAPANTGGWDGH